MLTLFLSTAKITKPLADETALAMPAAFGESKGKFEQTQRILEMFRAVD